MKDYFSIIKPGIIYGNAVTVVAGFLLASRGRVDWLLLMATIVGLSLVVASGCVMNNYIDRDIDGMMERTKNRPLVRGAISPKRALVFGKLLAILGLLILYVYTNLLVVAVSLFGLFVYVVVYSMWLKRSSTHGTIVGSISGAIPPVVGYLAVSNSIDLGAVILLFILALWQMPHSFAIAIYRLSDYTKAKIPVLPVKKGIAITKIYMVFYTALFVMATFSLAVFGYVGYAYFSVMMMLGFGWLGLCAKGFYVNDDKLWARNMFIYSIIILVVFCIMIGVESLF
ncbi:MAG: protoheme IX farnesyltransferase [Candidatus Yonathbacteria bacterium]|nr:protoheme IX farnesyltransferase [Candidatus Yonathbacteria bacterium]